MKRLPYYYFVDILTFFMFDTCNDPREQILFASSSKRESSEKPRSISLKPHNDRKGFFDLLGKDGLLDERKTETTKKITKGNFKKKNRPAKTRTYNRHLSIKEKFKRNNTTTNKVKNKQTHLIKPEEDPSQYEGNTGKIALREKLFPFIGIFPPLFASFERTVSVPPLFATKSSIDQIHEWNESITTTTLKKQWNEAITTTNKSSLMKQGFSSIIASIPEIISKKQTSSGYEPGASIPTDYEAKENNDNSNDWELDPSVLMINQSQISENYNNDYKEWQQLENNNDNQQYHLSSKKITQTFNIKENNKATRQNFLQVTTPNEWQQFIKNLSNQQISSQSNQRLETLKIKTIPKQSLRLFDYTTLPSPWKYTKTLPDVIQKNKLAQLIGNVSNPNLPGFFNDLTTTSIPSIRGQFAGNLTIPQKSREIQNFIALQSEWEQLLKKITIPQFSGFIHNLTTHIPRFLEQFVQNSSLPQLQRLIWEITTLPSIWEQFLRNLTLPQPTLTSFVPKQRLQQLNNVTKSLQQQLRDKTLPKVTETLHKRTTRKFKTNKATQYTGNQLKQLQQKHRDKMLTQGFTSIQRLSLELQEHTNQINKSHDSTNNEEQQPYGEDDNPKDTINNILDSHIHQWLPNVHGHKVKEDSSITSFTKHILAHTLKLLESVKKRSAEYHWKKQINHLAENYEIKFKEFIRKIGSQHIKTKIGRNKVLFNIIDVSNNILNRLLNMVVSEMDRKGILRYTHTAEMLRKQIKNEMDYEYSYACWNLGVCRIRGGFIDFLVHVVSSITSFNKENFVAVFDRLTETLTQEDFSNALGSYTYKRLKRKIALFERKGILSKRAMVTIIKNILANRYKPVVVFKDTNPALGNLKGTLAFLEIVNTLDEKVPNHDANVKKWHDLSTAIKIIPNTDSPSIQTTVTHFVSHIKTVLEHLDGKSLNKIRNNFRILLS